MSYVFNKAFKGCKALLFYLSSVSIESYKMMVHFHFIPDICLLDIERLALKRIEDLLD